MNKYIGFFVLPDSSLIRLFALGGLALLPLLAFTQKSEWYVYNASNSGIADNVVFYTTFQEPDIKWIGTNNGLSKFNGTEWTTYRTDNSGLPADIVQALMVDETGRLWIGTDGEFITGGGGLAIFDGSTWKTFTPSNSAIPDNWVTSIVMDKKGTKWVGTDNGVMRFEGENFTVLPYGWQTYYESVSSLAIEKDTVVLIGTGWGVSRWDNVGWIQYRVGNSGMPADNVWDVHVDTLGIVWIGTNPGGLAKFDGTDWTVYNSTNSGLPVDDVTSVVLDKQYTAWIGTWNGGLVSFHNDTWTVYNTSNSGIPSNIVYSVSIDKYGNKWIGTPSGLAVFNPGGILGIGNDNPAAFKPAVSTLGRNYPNPFNSSTALPVHIENAGKVSLQVTSLCGQEVLKIIDKRLGPGDYTFNLDGNKLAPGIYLCVLTTPDGISTRKISRMPY